MSQFPISTMPFPGGSTSGFPGSGGDFFDSFYGQYNAGGSMTPEQRAAQSGFSFDPRTGQYTRLRGSGTGTGTGSYRETRDPRFFEGSGGGEGRAQFASALFSDYMKQAAAGNENFLRNQAAIDRYGDTIGSQYDQARSDADLAFESATGRGDDFFDYGKQIYEDAQSRADRIESEFTDSSRALASGVSMGQARQMQSQLNSLDAMAKAGDQNAAAQADQLRFNMSQSAQANMTQLGAQQNQAAASLGTQLGSMVNQAGGVAQGFAGLANSMYQQGITARQAGQQYASNLLVQGREREAQMQMQNPFSPTSMAPVFMAMMGFDMNPFSESFSGVPESFLDGMNF
jgi:hypothetical protein